jgi:AcrR family transcriptional regulator
MIYDTNAPMRHIPKQSRGQRRVEHILRSAEALFAEIGFDNATTNAIALRAGVSIGSLYQFFSSKEAILATMAERYLAQTRAAMGKALDSPHELPLGDLLSELLETLVKLQEQRPYFLQCLGQSRPSPVLTDPVMRLNAGLTDQVFALLRRGTTEIDPKLLRLRARICVETLSSLLPLALHVRGRERVTAIREITAVMMRYLEPTLKVKGVL